MKRMTVAAISALGCLSLAAMTAEARVVWHYKTNGAFAGFESSKGGDDYASFSVSKGGTLQAPETYINYYRSGCDWESGICQGVNAYGRIPNGHFSASAKSATLNTNTAGNPDIYASRWTYNYYTGEYSESPTTLGALNLAWKSTGISTSKGVGSYTNTYLNFTWKSTGQYSQADASVTGTIDGESVEAFLGSIGTNSNNDLSLEKP
jgi:hypothetical protein